MVAIVGFGVGIVVMFGFRAASDRAERRCAERGPTGVPVGPVTATGIDELLDELNVAG